MSTGDVMMRPSTFGVDVPITFQFVAGVRATFSLTLTTSFSPFVSSP